MTTVDQRSSAPGAVSMRSIRWRVQLGLLKDVPNKNDSGDTSEYLKILATSNESLVTEQRRRYEQLAEKHFRQSSALAIIGDTEKRKNTSPMDHRKQPKNPLMVPASSKSVTAASSAPSPRTGKVPKKKEAKVVVDDPLSLMASIEEKKVQVEKEKEMQQKKERAMANRPHLMHHPAAANADVNQNKAGKNVAQDANSNLNGVNESQSTWDAFYSGKEIMDIIDKDLDRLPIDHHIYFHQRKTNRVITVNNQEWNAEDPISMQSRAERSKLLSEILFVYAKENPLGYRQGMHEILSFLMMTIEIDLMQRERSVSTSGDCDINSRTKKVLFNSDTIIHDAYCIFNAVMEGLSPAFESRDEGSGTQNSMEKMGLSTMDVIGEWHGDEDLVNFISNLGVPPELYCTRWIRLMFSREVEGLDNVFQIWDEFFQQFSASSGKLSMMRVLETTAAAFIILIQDQLIPPIPMSSEFVGEFDGGGSDDHEAIHLLMNYPRIQDTSELIETVRSLIWNQISGVKPAKIQSMSENNQPLNMHPPTQMNVPVQQQAQHPGMYNMIPNPNQHQHQHQVINDNIYYTHHHGPDPNIMMNHSTQPNMYYGQQQRQRETIRSTLKNMKKAPTWTKVSSGFNAALKTAIDTVQSIDTSLQHMNLSGGPGVGTNVASNSVVNAHQHHIYHHGNFNVQSQNELSLGYRDTHSIPSSHDDQHSVHISLHDPNYSQEHIETEESFVGDRNVQNKSAHTDIPQNQTATGNVHTDTSDLSLQLARRIDASISNIALHLQATSSAGGDGSGKDVWYALSELEAIRDELISKYEVSLK